MLALSPTLFQTFGWPLDDPTANEQIYFSRENDSNNTSSTNNFGLTFPNFLNPHPNPENLELDHSTSFTDYSCGDPNMVKKLNHNASERDRRKKMNSLYSSLRSLLPADDQMKKLSIPSTVSRVLKYIPELQKEVEKLQQKKEDILSKISKQENHLTNYHQTKRERTTKKSSNFLAKISVTQLTDTEIMVQISTYNNNIHKIPPLSDILLSLLEEGLLLINSSSFQSFEGRVFYNLHLKVEGTQILEPEAIREKLLSLYETRKGLFP